MSEILNTRICPEDPIRVLLPAASIPGGSRVTKRSGEQQFTLRHKIKVYRGEIDKKLLPLEIEGIFLIGDGGLINQVKEDTLLHWNTTAKELVDILQLSWEETPQ